MLRYSATCVELSVQSVYDVLKMNRRSHDIRETIESTCILKDEGFKILYHIMLSLPGIDLDQDIEIINEISENPDFRPDMLKIYPIEVVEGTELYKWLRGEMYKP